MAENITHRIRNIIQKDRLVDIRERADSDNTFCMFASLYEIEAALNTDQLNTPRLSDLWEDYIRIYGNRVDESVGTEEFFDVLEQFQSNTSLRIRAIYANPSFISLFNVPDDIKEKITHIAGDADVDTPHMRVMAQESESEMGTWHTHAEVDLGDDYSTRRFEELDRKGWKLSPMAILFEKQ